MSDTSDFRKLEVESEGHEEDSSFATWLPPLLNVDSPRNQSPATLTGLGPPSAPRASLFPPAVPGIDTDAAALAAELREALDDGDDDEPTRVITQLFPSLTPKSRARVSSVPRRSAPPPPPITPPAASPPAASPAAFAAQSFSVAASPGEPSSPDGTDPLPVPFPPAVMPTAIDGADAPDAGVSTLAEHREGGSAEQRQSGPVSARTHGDVPDASIAHATTQESDLTALMLEGRSKRSSPPPPVRMDEPAVVIQEVPLSPSEALAAQQAPGGQLFRRERDRPTIPASRRPTPPSELVAVHRSRSDPPWSATVRPKTSPTSRAAVRMMLVAGAASALVTVLVLRAVLPGKGSVLVTAVGAAGMPVENARVFVDGALACSPVPCRASKLTEGRHVVTVSAPGYQPMPEKAVNVESGGEALLHFGLTPEHSSGLHVRVDAPGIRVFLNGEDRGDAPLTLGGLPPGEHTVRLAGHGYATYEQKVTLKPNAVATLAPEIVPMQAIIAIQPGSGVENATIEVTGGPQRKAVVELPARIEVPASGKYRVRATRAGYQPFDTEVTFASGQTEHQVVVELVPVAGALGAAPAAPIVLEDAPPRPKPAAVDPAASTGTLSLNSIPISSVLVNGRPVGSTPRQLQLPPGTHSIVFVHPTLGRKSLNVNVAAGKAAVAAMRF